MNILIAPDKFKGSLSALKVAQAIQRGIEKAHPSFSCHIHPLADGGDGSIEILSSYLELEEVAISTIGPLGNSLRATYYVWEKTALVELATASGLVLIPEGKRNPLFTSTYGTGQLIAHAQETGATELYLFLGGSATNDGGMGIAQALGYQFLDRSGKRLEACGGNLIHIHRIIPPSVPIEESLKIICLCDVQNPLLGSNGATHVYAEQKGADREIRETLELGMENFAQVVEKEFGVAIGSIPGGGAAGGIAAGLYGMLGAEIKSGVETIFSLSGFDSHIPKADLVISGEGRIDSQTLEGKVIKGVWDACQYYQKPLVIFAGTNQLTPSLQANSGLTSILTVDSLAKSVEESIQQAAPLLEELAFRYFQENF